jgi:hypothetical protein
MGNILGVIVRGPVVKALTRVRDVWGSIPKLVRSKNLGQVSDPTLSLATQQQWVRGGTMRAQCRVDIND